MNTIILIFLGITFAVGLYYTMKKDEYRNAE